MIICRKKNGSPAGIFSFLFVLTLCFLSYYWRKSRDWYPVNGSTHQEKLHSHSCKGQGYLTNATITPLRDKNSFIIAPYSDKRDGNFIRVLSIVHHEKVKELYCMFCCQNSNRTVIVKAEIDIHSDRFEFPYGMADLLCLEPQGCDPQFISVHPSADPEASQLPLFQIQNLRSENPTLEFTVCISTMFGEYSNVLQFVQSIELYKILGAQKVMIYKNSCSPLLEQVLEYYISEGTVEIIPWPIHLYLKVSSYWHHSMDEKDIGYYGQITALNDCVYHNMYRSKYVVLIDADEVILPIKDADWKSLMQRLEKENPEDGVFLFENQVFRKTVVSTTPFNFSSWRMVPGVNMFEHIHKEPNRIDDFNNRKMIVDPRKVIQTSVHSILKSYGDSIQVSNHLAINFHCRIPERKDLPDNALIRDSIFWRYNKTLIAKVNNALLKSSILGPNGPA
ncbi:uncharacterized protein LOC134506098 [Candoia aspera]|uniref:uncharacterized protein LOC134506098 n=1 Tax=Candoia aspera TaxID=51853 RepID=UPI002FD7A44A